MLLGRAFQIQDDIMEIFSKQKETGKSNLTDIKEAKKTLLIWYAFNHADEKDKLTIKKIMESKSTKSAQLLKMRKIITDTGALAYAKDQIKYLFSKATEEINSLNMEKRYKQTLGNFSRKILKI